MMPIFLAEDNLRNNLIMLLLFGCMLGIGIFGFFVQRQIHTQKRWLKYMGVIPILGLAIYGFITMNRLNDAVYVSYENIGSGMTNLHRAAFWGPLAVAAGMVLFGVLYDKREVSDV